MLLIQFFFRLTFIAMSYLIAQSQFSSFSNTMVPDHTSVKQLSKHLFHPVPSSFHSFLFLSASKSSSLQKNMRHKYEFTREVGMSHSNKTLKGREEKVKVEEIQ